MGRWVLLIPLLGLAASVAAADSNNWQPTGPFKISPTANRCIASTYFKRGKQQLLVALEAQPTNATYEMRLYAPGRLRVPWDDGKFSLGTVELEHNIAVVRPSAQHGAVIYQFFLQKPELVSAGPSPDLQFREILDPGDVTVAGLGAALPLLDACTADLLERWGYSNELQQSVASPPKPIKDWASYVSTYDYPVSAVISRDQGETHALIDVGVDGQASNCRIIRSSGHEQLDKTTCMVVTERARYEPARNSNGEFIRAPLYLTFRWEMPRL
jgi:TonB family protein